VAIKQWSVVSGQLFFFVAAVSNLICGLQLTQRETTDDGQLTTDSFSRTRGEQDELQVFV
jgi:hypothetical protein